MIIPIGHGADAETDTDAFLQLLLQLIKTDDGYLEMKDGSQVEISRRRKTEVMQLLGLS